MKHLKKASLASRLALGAFCYSAFVLPAHAAPVYWDTDGNAAAGYGGDGTWDTSTANWNTAENGSGALQAWVTGDSANFGGSGGNVAVGAGISTTGINFRAGPYAYAFSGSDIALTTNSFGNIISTVSGLSATISIANNLNLADAGPAVNSTYSFAVQGSTAITLSGDLTISGATAGINTLLFNLYNSSSFTYSGSTNAASRVAFQIGGTGTGNGTRVTLSGSNATIAATVLNKGTLVLDHDTAVGTHAITIANVNTNATNDTAILLIGGGRSINNTITVATNAADTATGEVRRIGGEFTSGSASFTNTLSVAAQKQATGLELTSAAGGRVNFTGSITGAGLITKVGDGVVAFSRPNAGTTHSGGITVAAGTLLANGFASTGTSTVTVNSGATLGGNGTVGGAITINAGGRISPGDMAANNTTSLAGNLTGGSSLTWHSDNTTGGMRFDLGADQAGSDQIILAGAFTKGSGTSFIFDFTDLGVSPSVSYTLLTFASTNFVVGDFEAVGVAGTFTLDATSLTFTAVPEPSAFAAFAGLAGLGAVVSRRRRN